MLFWYCVSLRETHHHHKFKFFAPFYLGTLPNLLKESSTLHSFPLTPLSKQFCLFHLHPIDTDLTLVYIMDILRSFPYLIPLRQQAAPSPPWQHISRPCHRNFCLVFISFGGSMFFCRMIIYLTFSPSALLFPLLYWFNLNNLIQAFCFNSWKAPDIYPGPSPTSILCLLTSHSFRNFLLTSKNFGHLFSLELLTGISFPICLAQNWSPKIHASF